MISKKPHSTKNANQCRHQCHGFMYEVALSIQSESSLKQRKIIQNKYEKIGSP